MKPPEQLFKEWINDRITLNPGCYQKVFSRETLAVISKALVEDTFDWNLPHGLRGTTMSLILDVVMPAIRRYRAVADRVYGAEQAKQHLRALLEPRKLAGFETFDEIVRAIDVQAYSLSLPQKVR